MKGFGIVLAIFFGIIFGSNAVALDARRYAAEKKWQERNTAERFEHKQDLGAARLRQNWEGRGIHHPDWTTPEERGEINPYYRYAPNP